jgi:hypothetical protein
VPISAWSYVTLCQPLGSNQGLVHSPGSRAIYERSAPAMSRTDTAVRVIRASPDRVFAALTDSDALAGWPKPRNAPKTDLGPDRRTPASQLRQTRDLHR